MSNRITWDNLWKAFQATPGTRGIRFRLTLWVFVKWAIVGLGVFIPALVYRHDTLIAFTLCSALGGWIGGVLAFFSHEFFTAWWIEHVAKTAIADTGDVIGCKSGALLELEGWTGPVA